MTPNPSPRLFRILWRAFAVLPPRIGSPLRVRTLRMFGATIAEGTVVGSGVILLGPRGLVMHRGAGIARDATIDARAGIVLGEHSMVGFEAVILSWTHRFDRADVPVSEQGFEGAPVEVGSGAWIGARAFVFPGTRIGSDAIIGAASVVTRSVDDRAVVAGNPAKVLRTRDA